MEVGQKRLGWNVISDRKRLFPDRQRDRAAYLDEEDNEEMLKEEIEIRIASTERSQYINIDDLLSHRFPAGNTTPAALYAPEPGFGVAQAMDRNQLHLCYAGLGD